MQLLDHRRHAALTAAARVGRDALPAQQKAHEVLRRHRLDLAAQPALRVAMDAVEQSPRAVLLAALGRLIVARQHEALVAQPSECQGDRRRIDAGEPREPRRADRPRQLELSTHRARSQLRPLERRPLGVFQQHFGGAAQLERGPKRTRRRRHESARPASTNARNSDENAGWARISTRDINRSCSSSASRGAGSACSRTRAMASGSSPKARELLAASRGAPARRACGVLRAERRPRTCTGARSRFRAKAARARWCHESEPHLAAATASSSCCKPLKSMASFMQSCTRLPHQRVIRNFARPVALSWQAASAGKSAAVTSSVSIRWIGGGLRRRRGSAAPPRRDSSSSASARRTSA